MGRITYRLIEEKDYGHLKQGVPIKIEGFHRFRTARYLNLSGVVKKLSHVPAGANNADFIFYVQELGSFYHATYHIRPECILVQDGFERDNELETFKEQGQQLTLQEATNGLEDFYG